MMTCKECQFWDKERESRGYSLCEWMPNEPLPDSITSRMVCGELERDCPCFVKMEKVGRE